MSRKIIKGVLFFGGLAVAMAVMTVFFTNFISTKTFVQKDVFINSLIVGAVMIPASITLLMHAKDVRETKRALSIFCHGLAIFWLVTGGINLVGGVVLMIIFT